MELNDLIINIPEFKDSRGVLSVVENDMLPFKMKRLFYLYGVPKDSFRGGHAHIEHLTFMVAINGSFDVNLTDKKGKQVKVKLDSPNKGLFVPNLIWHELNNFSKGAVCLVIASDKHDEKDYLRDFDSFKKFK